MKFPPRPAGVAVGPRGQARPAGRQPQTAHPLCWLLTPHRAQPEPARGSDPVAQLFRDKAAPERKTKLQTGRASPAAPGPCPASAGDPGFPPPSHITPSESLMANVLSLEGGEWGEPFPRATFPNDSGLGWFGGPFTTRKPAEVKLGRGSFSPGTTYPPPDCGRPSVCRSPHGLSSPAREAHGQAGLPGCLHFPFPHLCLRDHPVHAPPCLFPPLPPSLSRLLAQLAQSNLLLLPFLPPMAGPSLS